MIDEEDEDIRAQKRVARPLDQGAFFKAQGRKKYALDMLGFTGFRPGQEEVFNIITAGRDTIFVAPTGLGKTESWTLPILAMDERAIVFSPLVALMDDQVKRYNERFRIPAAQISGLQQDSENMLAIKKWIAGEVRFLYVAPERLDNEEFKRAVHLAPPGVVIVDEVHTLSAWSHNFRPAYKKIARFIDEMKPKVVCAFTATFSVEVEDDVRSVLGMQHAGIIFAYVRRENLKLFGGNLGSDIEIKDDLERAWRIYGDGSAVVYCSTIKNVGVISNLLSSVMPGVPVGAFHGQMQGALKRSMLNDFKRDTLKVMVATNAFGMGVDKPNVRAVVHHHFPGSIEALAQEIGRAGRDGADSYCKTYWSQDAERMQMNFIRNGYPGRDTISQIYDYLQRDAANHRDGLAKVTSREVSIKCGVFDKAVDTCRQILRSFGVIESVKKVESIARVKIVGRSESDKFRRIVSKIEELGEQVGHMTYDVSLEVMSQRMQLTTQTVRNHMKNLHEDGFIAYTPPFAGRPIRITGDLSLVDWDFLMHKRELAHKQLNFVQQYISAEDAEKHNYLESYYNYRNRAEAQLKR